MCRLLVRAFWGQKGPWGGALVAERVGSGGQREGQFGVWIGDWGLCGLPVRASRSREGPWRVAVVAQTVRSGGQREGQFNIGVGIGVCMGCL